MWRWLLVVSMLSACTQLPDSTAPPSVAPFVEAARESLHLQDDRHRSFVFRQARCRRDGGVVLLFEQYGRASEGLAFAMSGVPGGDPWSWGGGFAPIDPATDPELLAFFRESPEVACD